MVTCSYLTLFLVSVGVYIIWMDVALYVNLQQVPPKTPSDYKLVNVTEEFSYSPFYPITMKLLMEGPTIQYIDEPLAHLTVNKTSIHKYLSADVVSIIGVVFALAAARLIFSESLKVQQLGVLLFKIRDYMDGLDGVVARERRHDFAFIPQPGTFGFLFDGICDGVGDLFLFIAVGLYLYRFCSGRLRQPNTSFSYFRLDKSSMEALPVKASDFRHLSIFQKVLPAAFLVLCVGLQTLVSSLMWNYIMYGYHVLLETNQIATTAEQMVIQNDILKSAPMWIIIYFWRLFMPHSLTQFVLVSVLCGKIFEYFSKMQFLGYLPLIVISIISQIHYHYAFNLVMVHETSQPLT